jgi:hypothetical protein
MADNPGGVGPANAAGGGEQSGGSGSAPASLDPQKIMERLEALSKNVETFAKTQENLRSLHDRQMTELRQTMQAARQTRQDDGDDGDDGTGGDAPKPGLTTGQLTNLRDSAITKFKVDHKDWDSYWKDIEAVGSDPEKSRRFVRYKADPDTGELVPDFYTSLVDIKEHIEMQRLRKQIEDSQSENQQAQDAANQARSDAGAIGGSPASIPAEIAGDEFKKLPYNEKVRKLVKLGLIDFDPKDPPEALR